MHGCFVWICVYGCCRPPCVLGTEPRCSARPALWTSEPSLQPSSFLKYCENNSNSSNPVIPLLLLSYLSPLLFLYQNTPLHLSCLKLFSLFCQICTAKVQWINSRSFLGKQRSKNTLSGDFDSSPKVNGTAKTTSVIALCIRSTSHRIWSSGASDKPMGRCFFLERWGDSEMVKPGDFLAWRWNEISRINLGLRLPLKGTTKHQVQNAWERRQ